MKKTITYIILSLAVLLSIDQHTFGQTSPYHGKLYGIITDSATKAPLELVTINLKTAKDSLVKVTLSKADGRFAFENIKAAKYHLSIVSTGYEAKIVYVDAGANTNLGSIYLNKQVKTLKEVVVTADRPIVQQKADRIIYDMQADPESKVSSVLNMIHKIPYLAVDADGNVSMKGSTSFKVLINGKPSGMLTNNLKEVLRSMPASTVVRIEVITIPPSKYDAEGMAGIINIITTKKVNDGYKGTFNVNESAPQGGPGVGGSFTAQDGKFGVNSYGGASIYNSPQTSFVNTRTATNSTYLQQSGYNKNNSRNAYLGTELSYEIDTLNLLSGNFNINGYKNKAWGTQVSKLDSINNLIQGYGLNSSSRGNGGGFDASLNYQLGFKNDKNTLLTFSYQYSDYGNNGNDAIDISSPVDYPTPDYRQYDNENAKEQTIQVDYVHPIKKVNMEAGVKAILRNSKSNSEYDSLDSASDAFVNEPALDNVFNYTQDVYGVYNSYQFSLKSWSFNAGVRAELTDVNADFISTNSNTSDNYFNVIPTIAINKSLKNNNSFSFGFTQRLRRPSIYRLNPYVDRSNPDLISSGNPNLQAATMNIVQGGYNLTSVKNLSLFIGVDYTFVNNLDLQVTRYDAATGVTSSTYENTGKGGGLESNIGMNYSPSKVYNLSVNVYALNLAINGTGDDASSHLDALLYHISVSNSFRLNKGWSMSANGDYNSRNPTNLQGFKNAYVTSSFSVNKELVKNKLFFSAAINNPFSRYRNEITETTGPGFYQVNNNQLNFRSVNFSLNYNFGRLKSDIKKNRKGINNDDVSNNKGGGL